MKYKVRGKIVRGIKEGEEILLRRDKHNKIEQYFKEIYRKEIWQCEISNNFIFDFTVDADKANESIARNKAVGYDLISGEMYKDLLTRKELKWRLTKWFKEYIWIGRVQEYFIISKLVLISKTNQEYPEINYTRPINILPTITKMFESSIVHNLE